MFVTSGIWRALCEACGTRILTAASDSMIALLLAGMAVPAAAQQLLGKDKMYLRITNTRGDASKILVRVNVVPNNDKWFGWNGMTVYVGTNGENPGSEVNTDLWIAPGQRSPWVDIGQYMARRGTRSPDAYLSPVLCGIMTSPNADGIHIVAEIATGQGTGVLRRLEINKPEVKANGERKYPWQIGFGVWNGGSVLPTVGLLVPTRPDIAGRIYTLEEALRWQLQLIGNLPDFGRKPEKFVFKASGLPEVMNALKYNDYPADTVEANQGDEIGLHLSMPAEEQDKRFREALKSRKFDPLELIADDQLENAKGMNADQRWELVHVLPPLPGKPKQFYESAIFRYSLWNEELAANTRKAESDNPGKRVLSGANFSPHMNVWPDVRQWVDPFKANALTMSWTEDWWWQLPEVSPQGYGFLLDGLRLAGSYHGAPMQFYVMPYQGNSPDNVRRMHALAASHGTKIFNHFVICDQTLITWDYIDLVLSANMLPALHDVMRDAGATEQRLYSAMPARADVAIMLSRASDTWDTEDLGGAGHLYGAEYNVNNEERKLLWLALRHAQYPVDLITDEDVAEGKLKPYKALYIVGSEMLAAAAAPLKKWVRDGGTVYATGGAGLLDEYRRPLTSLYPMYGIKSHELRRERRNVRPQNDLKTAKPLDALLLEPGVAAIQSLPALLYRQTYEPVSNDKRVNTYGKYQSDGRAGMVTNSFGKGRTVLVGALAGLAYAAPAVTPSSQILPSEFSSDIRKFAAWPAEVSGAMRPVETSDPLVEAQYMTGPDGGIVVLTNWREQPITELTLRFDPSLKVEKVRSLRAARFFKGHFHEQDRGVVEVKTVDGMQEIKLPLEVTDYLLIN